jgi:hypothetical protein
MSDSSDGLGSWHSPALRILLLVLSLNPLHQPVISQVRWASREYSPSDPSLTGEIRRAHRPSAITRFRRENRAAPEGAGCRCQDRCQGLKRKNRAALLMAARFLRSGTPWLRKEKTMKRLLLHRETIRLLSPSALSPVRGGRALTNEISACVFCETTTSDLSHWSACGCTVSPSAGCGGGHDTDFSFCVCAE